MKKQKNYAKLIKSLQIMSFVFMGAMIVTMLMLINKFDISIDNAGKLAEYISGGTLTVALIIIAFTVIATILIYKNGDKIERKFVKLFRKKKLEGSNNENDITR